MLIGFSGQDYRLSNERVKICKGNLHRMQPLGLKICRQRSIRSRILNRRNRIFNRRNIPKWTVIEKDNIAGSVLEENDIMRNL